MPRDGATLQRGSSNAQQFREALLSLGRGMSVLWGFSCWGRDPLPSRVILVYRVFLPSRGQSFWPDPGGGGGLQTPCSDT